MGHSVRTSSCLRVISRVFFCVSVCCGANARAIDFETDIRPILATHCFECHDANKQTADLRLDLKSRAFAGGESGEAAIVLGDSGASPMIARVIAEDPDERMPPEGPPLSAAEIKLLTTWIDAGAPWKETDDVPDPRNHWAFQHPRRPKPPAVKNESWIRNDIDRFILARLENEGITPSPEADKVTLLRRLHLDLIGLTPKIELTDQFLAADEDSAYDDLVDQLLHSPHYGERWGRHWLDAARYADSDGYEKDKSRQVWFYRDWVINAFNQDLPYDQFIIEQLAGDLIPFATQDQIVATGFLRNSMINEEGGIDPEQFRMEAMFDRMDAIGKSILGLTIQCGQCHSHKYDPLTQEEYYRMFAILNNDHEANVVVYTPDEEKQRQDIFAGIRRVEDGLKTQDANWQASMAEWEKHVSENQPKWTVLHPVAEEGSTGGQKYVLQHDGSLLAQGYAPTKHTVELAASTELKKINAIRLELLNDPNLPLNGPGRSIWGTAALSEIRLEARTNPTSESNGKSKPDESVKVKIASATSDINPPERPLDAIFNDRSKKRRVTGPIAFAIDGNSDTAWGIDIGPGRRNQPRKAVFVTEKPIVSENGLSLTIYLTQNHGGWNSDDNQNHNLGRFRLSVTSTANVSADPLPKHVRELLSVPSRERTDSQIGDIFSYWRTTVPEWAEANQEIEQLWESHPVGSSQLVLQQRDERRKTSMLKRGDFLQPGKEVSPGTPEFLHAFPHGAPVTRLTFANWLVDPRSPTVARAVVNRVWQAYFGTGIVATPEDLGTRCEPPSHPELLDWLAVEFMEQGWSFKKLHRLIVNSATYRQSSHVTPELYEKDQFNRLLARGARYRVEAEVVRDIALLASGLLNPKLGGPSVYPPLPEFMLMPPVSYGPKIWNEATGPDRYRRAVYTFRYRSIPYPVLQTFDSPNGDFSCVRRVRSNTPLQALMTLNEPIFVECAQALARHMACDVSGTDDQRIRHAFRKCLTRQPTEHEVNELTTLLVKQRERFASSAEKAELVAFGDEKKMTEQGDDPAPADLAAWTIVSRVLLNLDETITRE